MKTLKPLYAENFECVYYDDFKLLTVSALNRSNNAPDIYKKYFISHDKDVLEKIRDYERKNRITESVFVKLPVEKAVTLSSQNITYLSVLDKTHTIKGIDSVYNISSPEIISLAGKGEIAQVGEGREIDIETIYMIQPDIVFASWTGGIYDAADILAEKGIPAAAAAEWLEKHPLARAEWLVFVSVFFDMEDKAYTIFKKTEAAYNRIKKTMASAEEKPLVFSGMMYSGSWGVPAGSSFMAQFIKDAGGRYVWDYTEGTGSIFLDFETVLVKAGSADIWLLNSSGIKTETEITDIDSRYERFEAFRNRSVYNNNLRETRFGNPYWEEGSVYPEKILSDLARIFHPSILLPLDNNRNEYYFYRKVE